MREQLKGFDKGRLRAGEQKGQCQVVLEGAHLCTTGSACDQGFLYNCE